MKHRYEPSAKHFQAALNFAARETIKSSAWRFAVILHGVVLWACIAYGLLSILHFYKDTQLEDLRILSGGLVSLLLAFVLLQLWPNFSSWLVLSRTFSPGSLLSDVHTIELTDTHVVISVRSNTYSYAYADISRVDKDLDNIYGVIGSGAAIYVPLQSFGTAEDQSKFFDEFSRLLAANHSLQARPP